MTSPAAAPAVTPQMLDAACDAFWKSGLIDDRREAGMALSARQAIEEVLRAALAVRDDG